MEKPLRVFISYSHKDEKLKDALLEHLDVVRRNGLVQFWTDDLIDPGADWRGEIEKELSQADIALLLVSPSFLASRFIQDNEVPHMLTQQAQKGLRVIPVLMRDCEWQEHPALQSLHPLPPDREPITKYKGYLRDRAFKEVANKITMLARKCTSSGTSQPLIAIGQYIVAQGRIQTVNENTWNLSLSKLLTGDKGDLLRFTSQFNTIPRHSRFIVANEIDQARELASAPKYKFLEDRIELEVNVEPLAVLRQDVRTVESSSFERGLSNKIKGPLAGIELLQQHFLTPIGKYGCCPPSFGSNIGLLYEELGLDYLVDILKLEVLRLAFMPVDDRRRGPAEALPWCDFIGKFIGARALSDAPTEEALLSVELKLEFVGSGLWEGQIMIPVQRHGPIE